MKRQNIYAFTCEILQIYFVTLPLELSENNGFYSAYPFMTKNCNPFETSTLSTIFSETPE